MLINRSDTCRCTLLPNGHAPRNMHRIFLLFTSSSPTLCPAALLLRIMNTAPCTWCLHIIYIKRAATFLQFLQRVKKKEQVESAERMAETCPTKLLIILDWTTNLPPLDHPLTRCFAQSSADNKVTPVGGGRVQAIRNCSGSCPFMTCPREETINQSLAQTPSPFQNIFLSSRFPLLPAPPLKYLPLFGRRSRASHQARELANDLQIKR